MDHVEVDGVRIAYERAGEGPPVVLLHGFVGDGGGTWRHQIDALSDEFTVVAWDAPGAGRSSDVPESYRLPDYADCLAALLSALRLDRAHVIGLSFGGALALELYRRHRSIPSSLVLAGAYAGWAGSLPPDEVRARLARSLEASELPPDGFARAMAPSMFSASVRPDRAEAFTANVAGFHPSGFRAMALAFAHADLRDVLPHVAVPTLLLFGDADVRAPRPVAEHLNASIPGSRLVMLPGVGHVSSVEAPERFTEEILAFLRSMRS